MPVVPSDHGCVNVYTRSPLASSPRRSSATAPLAVYRIKRSNWSRRCAGTWVLACIVVRMIVWTVAVRSREDAIQYRKGIGPDTTHWRVGTQGMTRSTRCAAVWAIRRPAHDGQNPRLCGAAHNRGYAE